MSTSTIPSQQTLAGQPARLHLLPPSLGSASIDRSSIRRRANREQGHALEILGHAVEYLVDSRMFLIDEPATFADSEAVQILMRLSREVFGECREVTPPIYRLLLWISSHHANPQTRLDVPLSRSSHQRN